MGAIVNPGAEFSEESARQKVDSVPLSHLSIELGHLYSEDYSRPDAELVSYFERVAAWAQAAEDLNARTVEPAKPRVSTYFLIDDYFGKFGGPDEVIPRLEELTKQAGLRIDYLARESAGVVADGVELARLVERQIVAEPAPGDDGSRPPVAVTGWLSNGERSSDGTKAAMQPDAPWRPPRESAAHRHSVFMDVELWTEKSNGQRVWSCPALAGVWQLLRLGLLRDDGAALARPVARPSQYPDTWDGLPPVIQLRPQAKPFSAYHVMSIMDIRFINVEHAVRTILSQVMIPAEITDDLVRRAASEGIQLPAQPGDRLEYVFTRRSGL